MTWQPIETAPKDGQLIDLWVVSNFPDSAERGIGCRGRPHLEVPDAR